MRLASGRQDISEWTRSSSLLSRDAVRRSSLRQTILISRPYCTYPNRFVLHVFVTSFSFAYSDVGCKTVANMIKGRLRRRFASFSTCHDFTPRKRYVDLIKDNYIAMYCRDTKFIAQAQIKEGKCACSCFSSGVRLLTPNKLNT